MAGVQGRGGGRWYMGGPELDSTSHSQEQREVTEGSAAGK